MPSEVSPIETATGAFEGEPLATPVQFLKGVGPARAKLLAKLELTTVEDLLFYMPRDVLDLSVLLEA